MFSSSILPTTEEWHQFHVSKCQIEYNPREQALQIILHIFIDDLEDALRLNKEEKYYIGTEKEVPGADTVLLTYLREKFVLTGDQGTLTYNYLGKEVTDDLQAIWCYLEIPIENPLKELQISNDLLMEKFDDQKNIVSVNFPDQVFEFLMFEKGKSTETISIP